MKFFHLIADWKRRFRIPYSILIALLSVLTTTLMLLCLMMFFSNDVSEYVAEKSSNLYVLQTKILSDRIEHMFAKANNITNMILSDSSLRREVHAFSGSEQITSRIEPYNTLLKQLNRYALNHQNIANITLLTRENSISTGYKPLLNQELKDILLYLDLDVEQCREKVILIRSKQDITQHFVNSVPAGSLFFAAALYEEDTFSGLLLVGMRNDILQGLIANSGALYLGGELICGSPTWTCSDDWNISNEVRVIAANERGEPRKYIRSIVDNRMTFVLQEDLSVTYNYVAQFRKIMLIALGMVIFCAAAFAMTLLRRVMVPLKLLQRQIMEYETHQSEVVAEEHSCHHSFRLRLSVYLVFTVLVPILLYLGAYYATANYCIGTQMRRNYQNTFDAYADSMDVMLQEYCDAAQMMGLDISGMGTGNEKEIELRLLHDSKIWNLNLNMLLLDAQRNIVYATQSQNQLLLSERIRVQPFDINGQLITEIPGSSFYAIEVACKDAAHYTGDVDAISSVVVLVEEKQFQSVYSELCGAELIDVYVCNEDGIVISSNYANRIGKQELPFVENIERTTIELKHLPLDMHFFYNEIQLTRGVMDIVFNRLQSVLLMFLGLIVFSSLLGRMLVHPLERIRRKMDKCEIMDISEIYAGDSIISEIDALGNSFNDMKQRIDELMDNLMRTQKKEYQMEVDKHEAELHSLQAQIHPHFLCNLLESIRSLNELGDHAGANDMIRDLGDFFRYSISREKPMVLLEEEIAFTRAYCSILRRKYRDDICFQWECDPSALKTPVLRLLMQPLIENAVHHGLVPQGAKGTVRVFCGLQNEFLVLEVSDDGCGMDEKNIHQGVGLMNVSRRVELYYGGRGKIEIHSQPGVGTSVSVFLPKEVHESA